MIEAMLRGLTRFDINTVIDVGANVGRFTKKAIQVFPEAHIYAFEPLLEPFLELTKWADEQGRDDIVTFALPLGEKSGERDGKLSFVNMHRHEDHLASSSFLEATDACLATCPGARRQTIEPMVMRTLDWAMAGWPAPPELLIKVDVQGYEDRVIRGGLKTFAQARACIMEVCLDELYEGQADFLKLALMLNKLGLDYAGNVHQELRPDGHITYIDALFVRKEGE